MGDHLFISYKSDERPFTLKLAADLKNAGINIWVDKMDGIRVGDEWLKALGIALNTCSGLVAVLTPDYFGSQYCRDELNFAYRHERPIFPLVLRPFKDLPDEFFWLDSRQWSDFSTWLDEAAYQQQSADLIRRIRHTHRESVGDVPGRVEQYLNTLIAELERHQGVEEYITLVGQSETVRPDPKPQKIIDGSLALLLGKRETDTQERPEEIERQPISNIHQAVDQHPCFVLIGDPGAGKTTTLRRLALEDARQYQENQDTPLPFLIYLPRWGSDSLQAFLQTQWEAMQMSGNVLMLLREGRLHLYLDGLNEMGNQGADKAKLLREWLASSDQPAHAIITCRRENYGDELDLQLPTVVVDPLTDDLINQFAHKYLKEAAADFLEKVFPLGGARRKAGIIQMEPAEVKKWEEMEWRRTRISEVRRRVEAEDGSSSSPLIRQGVKFRWDGGQVSG